MASIVFPYLASDRRQGADVATRMIDIDHRRIVAVFDFSSMEVPEAKIMVHTDLRMGAAQIEAVFVSPLTMAEFAALRSNAEESHLRSVGTIRGPS